LIPRPRLRLAASAIALALATAMPPAGAATLGRLQVLSAPGQPLRAEVELQSVASSELASVSARLAAPEAFARAGLAWDPALAGARVAVLQRDGRLLVEVVSQRALATSIVDLLVEVSSPAGRQAKSYSLLVEAAGAARLPDAVDGRPVPIASALPPSGASSDTGGAGGGERIEVQRGDTLSTLALDRRPDGITLNQAMVAIYRANPTAFIGNLNLVKAGATLVMPDRAAMAAVDASEANRVVSVQAGEFAAWRSRLAASAVSVNAPQGGQSLAGEVGAGAKPGGAGPIAGDRLVLSRPEPVAPPETGIDAGTLGTLGTQASRAAADEAAIAREAALREAASRIADLERNVAELQQLLALRSQTLADAQRQVEDARQAGRTVAGQVGGTPTAEGEALGGVPSAAASGAGDAAAPSGAAPGAVDAAAPSADAPAGSASRADASAVGAVGADALPAGEPRQPTGWLPGIVAVGALGLLFAWFLSRRRRADEFAAVLAGAQAATGPSATAAGGIAVAGAAGTAGLVATEADPIIQAERHRAVGRLDEAEAVLAQALRAQPGNESLRFKLLEVRAERRAGAAPGAPIGAAAATDLARLVGSRIELPSLDLDLRAPGAGGDASDGAATLSAIDPSALPSPGSSSDTSPGSAPDGRHGS
jgi:pilus assembly protein FimV